MLNHYNDLIKIQSKNIDISIGTNVDSISQRYFNSYNISSLKPTGTIIACFCKVNSLEGYDNASGIIISVSGHTNVYVSSNRSDVKVKVVVYWLYTTP